MSDPSGLESRLRAALGAAHPMGTSDAGHGARDAAKTRVLAGIRRRRVRRLQVMGAAAVVLLGLAVSLPQVLGRATPTTQAAGTHSKSSPVAFAPSMHATGTPSASPAVHSAVVATATCRVDGRTVTDCGALATGSAAQPASASAASTQKGAAFGTKQSAESLGSPLVVHAGARVVIELPRTKGHLRWDTPTIAGTPEYHGSGPPVTVRSTRSRGATQQFTVTTKEPVTVVLEAQDDLFTGPGEAPSIVAGSTAAWALELKVEGT